MVSKTSLITYNLRNVINYEFISNEIIRGSYFNRLKYYFI